MDHQGNLFKCKGIRSFFFFFLRTNAKQSALGAKSKNFDFDTRGKVTYWSLEVQHSFSVFGRYFLHMGQGFYIQ